MNDQMGLLERLYHLFVSEGGGAFLQAVVLLGILFFVARLAVSAATYLTDRWRGAEKGKEMALRELIETVRKQHDDCQLRVQQLESRVVSLEKHNESLNEMIIELRSKLYRVDPLHAR